MTNHTLPPWNDVIQKEVQIQACIEPMLQFFEYLHLPYSMQEVSAPFCELAKQIVERLPQNPERTATLRKLLEAKDCAVRASIYV